MALEVWSYSMDNSMVAFYSVDILKQYISWEHFFFTWNVASSIVAASKLKEDALNLLNEIQDKIRIKYLINPFIVHSEGDDIIFGSSFRIPFLRQQIQDKDGYCICMSDYVGEIQDKLYIFATTVDRLVPSIFDDDPYKGMLIQTLCDRLAEAAAERLQKDVEKIEKLNNNTIIRPAVGYPSIPDMSINFLLNQLCDFSSIGIQLTDNGMMQPHASISGLMILNPNAHYFSIGHVSEEQIEDYARRRGFPINEMKRFIYA